MITAWAHLPNAQHIDQVLANLKAGKLGTVRNTAWDAAWDAAREAAKEAAWDAAREAAREATWSDAREATWSAAWGAAREAARGAVAALIAYDDCAHILTMPLGSVRLMVSIQHPAATLIFPYLKALELHSEFQSPTTLTTD